MITFDDDDVDDGWIELKSKNELISASGFCLLSRGC